MKNIWMAFRTVFIFLIALRCDAAPQFVGYFTTGGKLFIGLQDDSDRAFAWSTVGGQFRGFKVLSFDPASETVRLEREMRVLELKLKASTVESAPTVALIEQLAQSGDSAMQKLLPDLKTLESRRAKTAAELAALEQKSNIDETARQNAQDLRRTLALQEKHLTYFLNAIVSSRGRTQ